MIKPFHTMTKSFISPIFSQRLVKWKGRPTSQFSVPFLENITSAKTWRLLFTYALNFRRCSLLTVMNRNHEVCLSDKN